MNAIRFKLSGKTAFFKNPEVNSYLYFTYGNIHKVALLGVLGAIQGYGGYMQMSKETAFPEFYEKLCKLKVAILPEWESKGSFSKKVQSFNNSVGYASKEQGGNLIVKQQWLENPSWYIYILLDCKEAELLSDSLLNHNCVFVPYLGSNNHLADITEVRQVNCHLLEESDDQIISSLFKAEDIETDIDLESEEPAFRYEEYLPMGLRKNTNMYITEKLAFTNMTVTNANCQVYVVEDKNIAFI